MSNDDAQPTIPKQRPPVEQEMLDHGTEDLSITSWRIFRVMAEFVAGFDLLRKYDLAATVFGSARSLPTDHWYKEAHKLSYMLAKHGFAMVTGGGGGIMGAANKGAYEAGGASVGLNIRLPHEQHLNSYVTDSETFRYFFPRKVMLSFASEVYIYFPGGFGTLDEFFEILTLVQTGKIAHIPIVLVGKAYWDPMVAWCKTTLLMEHKTISEKDLDLFVVVDSADEAHAYICERLGKNVCRTADVPTEMQ
jgi:uncharacterized protein (TIGR00730 family)